MATTAPTPTSPWSVTTSNGGGGGNVPILPNELLVQIVFMTELPYRGVFLSVCRFTNRLVSQHVYQKAVFPEEATMTDMIRFCYKHGQSLEIIKLPQRRCYYPDTFFTILAQLCPKLSFLQSSITPKQLVRRLLPVMKQHPTSSTFMLTHVSSSLAYYELDLEQDDDDPSSSPPPDIEYYRLACCSCCLAIRQPKKDDDVVTHISHYYHHPGALRSAILPTFGSDLVSLTLNPYDILTASVAHMIIAKCPRLRLLVVPTVKADGLWMMLRWCDTLVAVVVGSTPPLDDDDQDDDPHHTLAGQDTVDGENERAVATVESYKRVWCVHPHASHFQGLIYKSWHIGIIPRM